MLSVHRSHPRPALEAEKRQAGSLRGTRFHCEPETKSQLTEHEAENKKVTGHLRNSLNIIDGSGNNYIVCILFSLSPLPCRYSDIHVCACLYVCVCFSINLPQKVEEIAPLDVENWMATLWWTLCKWPHGSKTGKDSALLIHSLPQQLQKGQVTKKWIDMRGFVLMVPLRSLHSHRQANPE